ncbi:MAG: hypothetical protein JSW47_13520 [Phycisphaerales bacterium]|nr:MAG: hypothetical protein JSW47_13520 [Phycisphaerales bacterium]
MPIRSRRNLPRVFRWYQPRTGGWLDAGKIEKSQQTFETADRNDWVLLIN